MLSTFRNFWNIPAIIISLIIIGLAFIFFAMKISTISLPPEYEEIKFDGLSETVKIFKNQYGIPHIVADNETDMFFAIGWSQAQDRLWQMDYRRRTAYGTLAEVFGQDAVGTDKLMRSLEIKKISNQIYKSLQKKTKSILTAYAAGVNSYIQKNKKRLPFEFGALDYLPEEWQPVDCIALLRLFGFEMSKSFYNDLAYGEIAEKIGLNRIDSLIPGWMPDSPYILDEYQAGFINKHQRKIDTVKTDSTKIDSTKQNLSFSFDLSGYVQRARENIGITGTALGSSCWAIQINDSGKKTAYLANDSHLPLTIPSYWYQLHATCPTFNTVGLMLSGIPLFFSGRNDRIAFGMTNLMLDDFDFYFEKTDSSGSGYFTGNNEYRKFKHILDTIRVKYEEDIVYYRRATNRSSVISDIAIPEKTDELNSQPINSHKQRFLKKYCITFSWLGREITDELFALYNLNKSSGWSNFIDATNKWGYPALMFVYSDKYGNIGTAAAGKVPLRGSKCNPNAPNPGWLPDYSWTGFTSLNTMQGMLNPQKKYIVSANNKLMQLQPVFLTNLWEHPSRAMRIEEQLQQSNYYNSYSSRDAQIMLTDTYSMFAKSVVDTVLPILMQYEVVLDDTERQARNMLKKWDCLMSANSAAPMIFSVMLDKLLYNTFADELGDFHYKKYLLTSSQPLRKFSELLSGRQPEWFDNTKTKEYETRNFIILKSFKDAVDTLLALFPGMDAQNWKYGEKHTINLEHPLSFRSFLKPALAQGQFGVGGDNTTIHNTEYRLGKSYGVALGASMRFIAAMSDSVVYTSILGGASGENLSTNYYDQVQLWLNGGYVKLGINRKPSSEFKLKTVLNPKR